ncbi:MAG: RIP metalloprotease RseP [Lysobacterales bacterium]
MAEFFGSTWWLLVTLGLLITFHEFGHFVVARRCGVKVLRFSVGFGKALWSRRDRHGTEFVIAAIPLGGYVKMLDEREGEVAAAELPRAFTRKPVGQRIAIAAAGPVFNLLFALAAFWLMFVVGRPDFQPLVAAPTGLAASAGFAAGDRITAVGGEPVDTWSDALDAIAQAALGRQATTVTVETPDRQHRVLNLPLEKLPADADLTKAIPAIGLQLQAPDVPAIAARVVPGMPAAKAGLQDGDRIVAIDGNPVANFAALGAAIQKAAAESPVLALTIERGGATRDVTVHAERQDSGAAGSRWVTGIESPDPHNAVQRFGPLRAVPAAFAETWRTTANMFKMVGDLVSGRASTRNISGIIGIGQAANASAHMGVAWFLDFLALVSLSLAVMNLLPIPILDGGHLLYYLIELVKGTPVSERTQIAGQYVGLALLAALMGLAFYNDILRIVS